MPANVMPPTPLPKLVTALNFQAPRGVEEVKPNVTPPGQESIELIINGAVYFNEDGREIIAHPGAVFWHLPGEEAVHRYPAQSPYECLLVVFEHAAGVEPGRLVPRHTQWHDVPSAQAFAREVLEAQGAGQAALPAFGAYVYHRLFWNAIASSSGVAKHAVVPHLTDACDFIRRNIDADLTIDNVARTIGISSAHLHHLFRLHLGRTPHSFILEERYLKACNLLRGTRLQSKEIAYVCGFRDAAEFSRTFRRLSGCTPREYRQPGAERKVPSPPWRADWPTDQHDISAAADGDPDVSS